MDTERTWIPSALPEAFVYQDVAQQVGGEALRDEVSQTLERCQEGILLRTLSFAAARNALEATSPGISTYLDYRLADIRDITEPPEEATLHPLHFRLRTLLFHLATRL